MKYLILSIYRESVFLSSVLNDAKIKYSIYGIIKTNDLDLQDFPHFIF